MKKILKAIVLAAVLGSLPVRVGVSQTIEPTPGKPVMIPTRYYEGRFYANPETLDNAKLDLLTDTAGGLFLYTEIVEKLHLTTETLKGAGDGGRDVTVVNLPKFKPGASIPPPLGSWFGERLRVLPRAGDTISWRKDGMLGQQWFAERVWTFDYPKRTLWWRASGDLPAHDKAHEVTLGFRMRGQSQERANNFARLPIEVDGETLDFVLDTGASNVLSEDALKQIGDGGSAERAATFLVQSVFEKWHQKHPEWRALENIKSLTGFAMIEVPSVKIGGFRVGPVWFTVQDDADYQSVMGTLTDKRVVGSLGGTALRYFRLTVDWPHAVAVFERPDEK